MKKYIFFSIFLLILSFCSCKSDETTPAGKITLAHENIKFGLEEKQIILLNVSAEWSVVDLPDWITTFPSEGEAGEYQFEIAVTENPSDNKRSGSFIIRSGTTEKQISVTQSERGVIHVLEDSIYVASDNEKLQIKVETNADDFSIKVLNNVRWIKHVTSKTLATKIIAFNLDINTTESERIAKVVFFNDKFSSSDTITIIQGVIPKVFINKEYTALYKQSSFKIEIQSNIELTCRFNDIQSWIKTAQSHFKNNIMTFEFELIDNLSTSIRSVEIEVLDKHGTLVGSTFVNQLYNIEDGFVATLQQATVGKGFDLIFMGDGFTKDEIEKGKYHQSIVQGIDHLFAKEPLKSMRDHFNIYIVMVHSNESGISSNISFPGSSQNVDTRLQVRYVGKGMDINSTICSEYTALARRSASDSRYLVTVIANAPWYGGSVYISNDGSAVGICPMSEQSSPSSFAEIMQHESGGHGIGLLADEYILNDKQISEEDFSYVTTRQQLGIYRNISLYQFDQFCPWGQFVGHPKYPEIAYNEGAFTWGKGIWRPTETSIMRDMGGEFNAPSRFQIAKRVKEVCGLTYTFEQFVEEDKLVTTRTSWRIPMQQAIPLPPPTFVD